MPAENITKFPATVTAEPPLRLDIDGAWFNFSVDVGALGVQLPETYKASGSLQTTTATTVAADPNVLLASAIDFAVGQGIRLNRCGATFALNLPTGLSVTVVGATGSTARKYAIRAIDDHGGLGPAVRATVANANATLDFTNYCKLQWSAPSGTAPKGYAVYGRTNVGDGSLTLIGVTSNLFFNDYGVNRAAECDWLVANDAGGPFNGYYIATITALDGREATVSPVPLQSSAGEIAAHDDTAAIQAMLAAASDRQLFHWARTYPVTTKIQFAKLGVHQGAGSPDGDASTKGAGLIWRGAPVDGVAQWGHTSGTTILQGGSMSDMTFDGSGVAERALIVKDASTPKFTRLKVSRATRSGVLLTCSPAGALNVATRFIDLFAPMREGNMVDAHCVEIDGLNNLLTLPDFHSLRGSFFNGHGVYWPPGVGHGAGDGVTFFRPFLFRTTAEFGYSIYVGTDDPAMVTGDIVIEGQPLLPGGIYIAQAGRMEHSSFNNLDTINVASNKFAAMPIEGPGIGEVGGNSINGCYYGWKKHPGGLAGAFRNEPFDFISYSGGILTTGNGVWLTQQTPAGGGSIQHNTLGIVGIELNTAASANQRLAIFGSPNYKPEYRPSCLWSLYLPAAQGLDAKVRVGFLLDNTSDPASRVSWRWNATTGFWECECADGVGSTIVASVLTTVNAYLRLRIDWEPTRALFYYAIGTAGITSSAIANRWTLAAKIETNLPTAFLRLLAQIETLDANAKRLALQHCSAARYMGGW